MVSKTPVPPTTTDTHLPLARQSLPLTSRGNDLYLAGERVPPGDYRQLEGTRRIVHLDQEDTLPASLDGRVAVYQQVR